MDQRDRLVEELRKEGIADERVLKALTTVPRELFVPPECRSQAYRNVPLPIGEGQTISQPFIVALMTQAAQLLGRERVLEIGTGSGYQCAILAELSDRVISMERFDLLAGSARERLERLGYTNVQVVVGDGSLGYDATSPYDAILVTAACPRVPQPLVDQLAENGRIVLPVGPQFSQELYLGEKRSGRLSLTRLGSVRFVPLVGAAAWGESEARDFFRET